MDIIEAAEKEDQEMVECWENICRPGGFEMTARAAELSEWKPGDGVLVLGCGTGESLR